jgi:EAL domain-containing protein (putative c-di-GMP-specific phosphodiesterase class I)
MISPADLGLLDGFERALINGRLHMVYQPKVSLADGSLKRVEALVRWRDPRIGMVPPSRFVPLAERHGLIDDLTQWGLRTALRQWLAWHEQGIDTCIAFNISALSLEQLDFPDLVERMCRALGVPTEHLVLELTEGATQPLVKLMDTLTRFRIKGIGLAIDDFGTGYSTLMQLRQLPFTELKIDRFFITDSTTSDDSALMVKCMVELAHGLGLTCTAEGVETADQLAMLCKLRCDVAQGYLIAQPLEPDALGAWLEEWTQRWPTYAALEPAAA